MVYTETITLFLCEVIRWAGLWLPASWTPVLADPVWQLMCLQVARRQPHPPVPSRAAARSPAQVAGEVVARGIDDADGYMLARLLDGEAQVAVI